MPYSEVAPRAQAEHDWVPVIAGLLPLAAPSLGRVVVMAPHPDDECLGAGGLICDLSNQGVAVDVVVVTDGAASHPHVKNLVTIRRNESLAAIVALGIRRWVRFLGLPDGRLSEHRSALTETCRSLFAGATLIVAPRYGDHHPDHDVVALAVADAVASMPASTRPPVWAYAIWAWHWQSPCQLSMDGAAVWDISENGCVRKRNALSCYRSQTTPMYGETIVNASMQAHFLRRQEVFWT